MIDKKLDIDALLKEYKESTQKILELLDESVINLEDDNAQEKIKEEEVNERAIDAELFWRKYMKKKLKLMTFQAIRRMGQEATVPVQVSFHRGILFAYQELFDWFNTQIGISAENRKKVNTDEGIKTVGEIKL